MNRTMAIIEREMRKFFRSPALMMVSMIFPLVQLIVLGNAFGGKIRDAKMGVVDEDHGTQAVRIKEAFDAVRATAGTFIAVPYDNEVQAREDVRDGKIQGAVIIPAQYSKMVYEKNHPRIALIVDNSDNFMSSTFEEKMTEVTDALNQPDVSAAAVAADGARSCGAVSVHRVHEVSAARVDRAGDVRVGDDRRWHVVYRRQGARSARGISGHSDYKGGAGVWAKRRGSDQGRVDRRGHHHDRVADCGCGDDIQSGDDAGAAGDDRADRGGFNTMMFLMMVRVEDPLVPRATFGILNTLLFFPERIDLSGAGVSGIGCGRSPLWIRLRMRCMDSSRCLLKETGLAAIVPDMIYLSVFAVVTLALAVPLFKRTL